MKRFKIKRREYHIIYLIKEKSLHYVNLLVIDEIILMVKINFSYLFKLLKSKYLFFFYLKFKKKKKN